MLVRLDDRDRPPEARTGPGVTATGRGAGAARRGGGEASTRTWSRSGLISPSSYEQFTTQLAVAEAAVAQAASQVAAAEKAVADAVIVAPFSGHVSARPVAVGEYVTTSTKVATVVRIAPIKLQLLVPEVCRGDGFARAWRCRRRCRPIRGGRSPVRSSALNVAIDPASRAMSIEVRFSNTDARLMPGMFGSAEVRLPATERGVFVPEAAVTALPNGESFAVYAVDGDAVRVRVVQPGERQNGMVRLLAGLDAGTRGRHVQPDPSVRGGAHPRRGARRDIRFLSRRPAGANRKASSPDACAG